MGDFCGVPQSSRSRAMHGFGTQNPSRPPACVYASAQVVIARNRDLSHPINAMPFYENET